MALFTLNFCKEFTCAKIFAIPRWLFEGRCKQLAAILAHSAKLEDFSSKGQNVYPRESKLGCRKVWKSGGAVKNVGGIICPPGWDRVNCNPKFRQGPGLGGLSSRGAPDPFMHQEKCPKIVSNWTGKSRFHSSGIWNPVILELISLP